MYCTEETGLGKKRKTADAYASGPVRKQEVTVIGPAETVAPPPPATSGTLVRPAPPPPRP